VVERGIRNSRHARVLATASDLIRDVRLRVYEQITWNADYPLIGAAAGGSWEFWDRSVRDVDPDDSKISRFQFENVRTITERDCLRAIRVRVWSYSSLKHAQYVTTVKYGVKHFVA